MKKFLSFIATSAILLNSFYAPLTAIAQEISPTPEPTPEATSTPEPTQTPEATIAPSEEPTVTPEATPTEIASPTPEIIVPPTDTGSPEPTEEAGQETQPQAPESNPTTTSPPEDSSTIEPAFTPVVTDENAVVSTEVIVTEMIPETLLENNVIKLITDKLDYSPTEMAIISGSGFIPEKTYSLTVSSTDDPTTSTTVDITADGNGEFTYGYQLDGNYRPNYLVEVKDGEELIASTSFTDSQVFNSAMVNGSSSVTVMPGEKITVAMTIQLNDDEPNDWLSSRYQIEGGDKTCVDTPDHANTGTHTEPFDITAPTSLGTYDLTLRAYDQSGCPQDGDRVEIVMQNAITVVETPPATNPRLPTEACGLDIALVLDVSGSINSTELTQMKNAFKAFVDAMAGTPTQFSVTQFDTTAKILLPFTSVTTGSTAIKNAINSAGGGNYTNWEDGLNKAWSTYDPRTDKFNLMIFSSDGNPNRKGTSGTSVTESEAVAAAVTSANTIKTAGTRILALGIGSDLDTANMIAISGSNVDTGILTSDVITSDFTSLAADLGELASKTCGGTITVNKYIDSLATPGSSGWEYTVSGGTTKNLTTSSDGTANTGKITAGTYSVVETNMLPGYSYGSATCKYQNGDEIGSPITNGWNGIVIGDTDVVSCDFINYLNRTDISIAKTDTPDPVNNGGTLTYTLTVNNLTTVPATNVIVKDTLPAGFSITSVTPSVGGCSDQVGPDIQCELGTLNGSASATVTIVGNVSTASATITNNASVSTDTPETSTANNGDSEDTTVNQKGHIVIDKVTIPSGDSQSFDFDAAGGAYADFSLTDGATPNSQELVAGTYSISESDVAGWEKTNVSCVSSIKDTETIGNIELDPSETITCTFTNTKLAKINVHKFIDKNANGVLDGTDSNYTFSDIAMELYTGSECQGTRQSVANTNGSGNVTFQNLVPGDYSVKEVMLPGADWKNSTPICQNISIAAGEEKQLNFGNYPLGTIYGFKYNDINANGVVNAGEPALSGWTINLVGPNGYSQSRVSNASGYVEFAELDYGIYTYSEVMQPGWMETIPLSGRTYTFTVDYDHLLPTGASGFIITNVQVGSITIIKNSVGGDETFNFSTDGKINPLNAEFSITTINNTGNILFSNLKPDRYQLYETVPTGWDLTNITCVDPDGQSGIGTSNPRLVTIDLDAGENITCTFTNTKHGIFRVSKVTEPSSDTTTQFSVTAAGNGTIYGSATQNVTGGSYIDFDVAPGTYSANESNLPTGWAERLNSCSEIVVAAGQTYGCTITNTKLGSISGAKTDATSGNGLSGWVISLYNTVSQSEFSTTTGDDGSYSFTNLWPSIYTLSETLLGGWTQTAAPTNPVTLDAGVNLTGQNFSNFENVSIKVCKVEDLDGDKDRTTDDQTPVQDWSMTLYDNAVQVGVPQFTGGDGCYTWTDLGPGNYSVTEESRLGWHNLNSTSHGFGVLQSGSGEHSWTFVNTKLGKVIVKKVMVGGTDSFEFTGDVAGTISTSGDTLELDNVIPGSDPTSIETAKTGWDLTDITCSDSDSITDISTGLVIFRVNSGEEVTCTFTNTKQNPVINVVKSSTTTSITTAGQVIPYVFTLTNKGNVTLTGITVTDGICDASPTYQSGDDGDKKLQLNETWIYTCNHTVTQGEIDTNGGGDGDLDNTVWADSNESPSDDDSMFIPITQSPVLNVIKEADVTSVDGAGDIITYTIKVENLGNQTLTGVSVTDPLISNLDCSPVDGIQNTNLTIDVASTLTCTGTYTVTEADINNYGGGDGDIDNIVTADSDQTEADTANETVSINGSITIIKVDNINSGQDFTFNYTPLGSSTTQFILDDDNGINSTYSDRTTYSNLVPNFYNIDEVVPFGWRASTVSCISNYPDLDNFPQYENGTGTMHTALRPGENLICTFENTRISIPLYVSKFEDLNENMVRDSEENYLDGWTFEIYDNDACTGDPIKTAITDSVAFPGTARFNDNDLYLGETYWIREVEQAGWTLTTGNCRSHTIHDDINSNNQVNFGNIPNGTIHGYKWSDYDQSGGPSVGVGEDLLSGWTINLYKWNGDAFDTTPITSMDTDDSLEHLGWYWFEDLLPGKYKVCEVGQNDWIQTYPINGDDNCHIVNLPDDNSGDLPMGQNYVAGPEYNFGNVEKGQVVVYKFNDLDADGKYEPGEPLLPGWEMSISPEVGESIKQTTDSDGNTQFTLAPAQYALSETNQEGWYQSGISCEDNSAGVLITAPGEAYGHHGSCDNSWNYCDNPETCALWACELNGYTNLMSYGESRPCTQFNNCNLFADGPYEDYGYDEYVNGHYIDWDWGNWCDVMGVTDIRCSNSAVQLASPALQMMSIIPSAGYPLTVNPGKTHTCYVGNYQKATLTVTKDVLGSAGEPLDDNTDFTVSVTGQGNQDFSELSSAQYSLDPGIYTVSEINIDPAYTLKSNNDIVVTLTSGGSETVNFTNWQNQPKITITKSNDKSGGTSAGSVVTYTLNLKNEGNVYLYDINVKDTIPGGFNYVTGSTTGSTTQDPTIFGATLTWNDVGNLAPNESLQIIYKVKIGSDLADGIYTNFATCTSSRYGNREMVFLESPREQENLIECNTANSTVSIGSTLSYGGSLGGQVLGISTELPATGNPTWLLLAALGLTGTGIYLNIRSKKQNKYANN